MKSKVKETQDLVKALEEARNELAKVLAAQQQAADRVAKAKADLAKAPK